MLHPSLFTLRGKFFCLKAKFRLVVLFWFFKDVFPAPKISDLCVTTPTLFYFFFWKQCPNTLCDSKEQSLAQSPEIFSYKSCISGRLHPNSMERFEGPNTTQSIANPSLAKQDKSQAPLERRKCGANAVAIEENLCKMGSN